VSALTDLLTRLEACPEAAAWAETQPDLATAWNACERGDWMLWLAGRVAVKREDVVLAACACARTALVHVQAGEDRPRVAIETAERWARGEATLNEVRAAAGAAWAAWAAAEAARAAEAAGATRAAWAAAEAARAAEAAAGAAGAAAEAAAGAAWAAWASAWAAEAAARSQSLAHSAALVRGIIPASAIVAAAEGQ